MEKHDCLSDKFVSLSGNMVLKKTFTDTLKIALSLLLGGAILYWMYRDFDFRHIRSVLLH